MRYWGGFHWQVGLRWIVGEGDWGRGGGGNVGFNFREIVKGLFHWVWEGNIIISSNNYEIGRSISQSFICKLGPIQVIWRWRRWRWGRWSCTLELHSQHISRDIWVWSHLGLLGANYLFIWPVIRWQWWSSKIDPKKESFWWSGQHSQWQLVEQEALWGIGVWLVYLWQDIGSSNCLQGCQWDQDR